MRFHPLLVAAILVVSACGGNVVVDATSSSTSHGTGGSSTSTGAGGASACPLLAPNEGEPCSSPGLECTVPICCGGTATCSGGAWHVSSNPCGQPCMPCTGTFNGCATDALCVYESVGSPVAMGHCAQNACAPQPSSCACVGPVCGPASCAQVTGTIVECNPLGG